METSDCDRTGYRPPFYHNLFDHARIVAAAVLGGGSLDPNHIAKFVAPLIVPPAMPSSGTVPTTTGVEADYYEIGFRQFEQQILPEDYPKTIVWSYGSVNHSDSLNYPAFTIKAKYGRPVVVKWINELCDSEGKFLPHLLPADQTLHWANPPGGMDGRDGKGSDPNPYCGPVPIVTHVHGAHTHQESDGYPEAWYLPNAWDIPDCYAKTGTFYDVFRTTAPAKWDVGYAVFEYHMQFRIVRRRGIDASVPPRKLKLKPIKRIGKHDRIRRLTLNEEASRTVNVVTDGDGNLTLACDDPHAEPFAPIAALFGTLKRGSGQSLPLRWSDLITENPALHAIEIWELHNLTVDAHPIHVHLVQFEVLSRQNMVTGAIRARESGERGFKDTVITYPDETTRIKARFDIAGLYVWHCHILEHEDNEMMRPYKID